MMTFTTKKAMRSNRKDDRMSIFRMPLQEVLLLNNWREILEARKRVVYKRYLAKMNLPFSTTMPTEDLKALYFIARGVQIQRWPIDVRQNYRRWKETEMMQEVRYYERVPAPTVSYAVFADEFRFQV